MKCVATAMRSDTMTDYIAQEALGVASAVVADMDQAILSGQAADIVETTVDVFQKVTLHLTAQPDPISDHRRTSELARKPKQGLARNLRESADGFCHSLTSATAAGATAIGSGSEDFSFNCQKIEQRTQSPSDKEQSDQVQHSALHTSLHGCLGANILLRCAGRNDHVGTPVHRTKSTPVG